MSAYLLHQGDISRTTALHQSTSLMRLVVCELFLCLFDFLFGLDMHAYYSYTAQFPIISLSRPLGVMLNPFVYGTRLEANGSAHARACVAIMALQQLIQNI